MGEKAFGNFIKLEKSKGGGPATAGRPNPSKISSRQNNQAWPHAMQLATDFVTDATRRV
jgi:hypothetical protein